MELLDYYKFKMPPLSHQQEVLEESWFEPSWAWFMEMGTGKSKITVDNFCMLYMCGRIDTVVIMAKKGEYQNWIWDQLPAHLPSDLKVINYLYGTARHRSAQGKREWAAWKTATGCLKVVVVNVESLLSDDTETMLTAVYKQTKYGVFFALDESTCAKHTTSKRSKKIYYWAAKSKYRRIMTGTDVANSPMDLWGQCLVLGKGMLGTTSFYSFRGTYANMEKIYLGARSIDKIASYRNLDHLKSVVLKGFSSRWLKKDCLDLPEKVYAKRIVELTKKQQIMYDTLRDEAILELENGVELEVTHVLTLLTKLHQIVCGQVKLSDTQYESIENNRLETLMSIIEDYEGKVIIWAGYRQTLADIMKELTTTYGKEAVAGYYGGVSDEDRRAAVQNFQDPNHPLRFFVGNPQSAGFGITLTQANLVIYYSNSYNLEHRLQSEDRAHRIGQMNKVTYVDLVTPGTVDEKIIKALLDKKNVADLITGAGGIRSWL